MREGGKARMNVKCQNLRGSLSVYVSPSYLLIFKPGSCFWLMFLSFFSLFLVPFDVHFLEHERLPEDVRYGLYRVVHGRQVDRRPAVNFLRRGRCDRAAARSRRTDAPAVTATDAVLYAVGAGPLAVSR